MAVKVNLTVNDSGFKAKMQEAVNSFKRMATAITGAKNAQQALNNLIKANPMGLITTAGIAAAEAIYKYAAGVYDAEKAQAEWAREIENTSNQLDQMKNDADFDIAIAKAAGKSSEELAKLRVEAAKARVAIADLNFDKVLGAYLNDEATKEQVDEMRNMQKAAEDALNAANRARTVLTVQKINGTGEFKPKKQKTKSVKEEKDEFEEIIGLIPNAEEAVKSLQEQIRQSWDEDEISNLAEKLRVAEKELSRLKDISKEIDIDNILPERDVSSQQSSGLSNFETLKQTIRAEIAFDKMEVDKSTLSNLLQVAVQNGIDSLDPDFTSLQEQIRQGFDIDDSVWQDVVDKINAELAKMELDPIKINYETGKLAKDGKAIEESWKKAGNAISGISGALSQIENPAAKIIGTIGQAIATIALAYAETLAQSKEKKNVWAFIATAAAAMVSMASTISSIHSSTGYAEGGIIKGNHYSGDMIGATVDGSSLVGLNAQEVVLNRAQSGVLASQLQGAGSRLNLRGVIRGEDILVAIDRSGQRQGKGELLFWK